VVTELELFIQTPSSHWNPAGSDSKAQTLKSLHDLRQTLPSSPVQRALQVRIPPVTTGLPMFVFGCLQEQEGSILTTPGRVPLLPNDTWWECGFQLFHQPGSWASYFLLVSTSCPGPGEEACTKQRISVVRDATTPPFSTLRDMPST
jgi:hypothetical protein